MSEGDQAPERGVTHDPRHALELGRCILDPVLESAGFAYVPGESGPSSGGPFARADYVCGDRRLELHFRWTLGLLRYHVGEQSLSHAEYVDAVAGVAAPRSYPGHVAELEECFEHLRADLERYGQVFLSGSDEEFAALAQRAEEMRARGVHRLQQVEEARDESARQDRSGDA